MTEPSFPPEPAAAPHDTPWRVEPLAPPPPARLPWGRLLLETGLVAAAATGGVLVRFGVAAGLGVFGAFAAIGRLLLGLTLADGPWAMALATVVGVLAHVAVVAAWTLLLVLVAGRWRGARLAAAAIGVAALAWLGSATVLPPVLRLGHGARAFPLQLVLLHVVLALGLGLGMRLAQLRSRTMQ